MDRQKWDERVAVIAHEPQLQTIEHLAHHAIWLLRRARATLEAAQSLSYDRSLPWAVEGTLRDVDPAEIGAIKAALEGVVEAIRDVRSRAEVAIDEELEVDEAEGDEIVEDAEPHLADERPVPCAS